jgi:hypothetical protein
VLLPHVNIVCFGVVRLCHCIVVAYTLLQLRHQDTSEIVSSGVEVLRVWHA